MKLRFCFISFLILSITSLSQYTSGQVIRCGTAELHKMKMENDAKYRAYYQNIGAKMHQWVAASALERTTSSPTITIPVVVHVLWNTSAQDISDAQIQSQITVLNEDYTGTNSNKNKVPAVWLNRFGNTNLNFCLASRTSNGDWTNGIERKQTSITSFDFGDNRIKYDTAGGLDAWDRNQYLNIWVCNLGGGLLGYTEMPGGDPTQDGCVILYSAFGRGEFSDIIPVYNLGRTATHEIGHWLGLFHVWGDDGGDCSGSDYIDDTPNQSNYTYGCPSFPDTDACAHAVDEDGISGDPVNGIMYMNYLDYSDDDCMTMFTVDQVAVMHGILSNTRSTILTSNGCSTPTGISEINAETFVDVYPNPANDIINFNSHLPLATVISVTAYDMLGNKVMVSEVQKAGEQTINLNVSTLGAGLYTLVVNTDQGNIAKHFAVVR